MKNILLIKLELFNLKRKRNKKISAFKVNIEGKIMRYFKINTVM